MNRAEQEACAKFLESQREPGRWVLHECSMCGYPCAYISRDGIDLFYDPGCGCVMYPSGEQPRAWAGLFHTLEMNRERLDRWRELWPGGHSANGATERTDTSEKENER